MDKLPEKTEAVAKSTISGEMNPAHRDQVVDFLTMLGVSDPNFPGRIEHTKDFYSDLLRSLLKVESISIGKVSCSFSVIPAIANGYNGLHGGVVAGVAERVAVACARTVVAEDKELLIGGVSLSYLSAVTL